MRTVLSKLFGKKNVQDNTDWYTAYKLLMGVRVYPWGKDWKPEDVDNSDERYMNLVYQRPRVQISVDANIAKEIMTWQHAMMQKYGDTPGTDFPSKS